MLLMYRVPFQKRLPGGRVQGRAGQDVRPRGLRPGMACGPDPSHSITRQVAPPQRGRGWRVCFFWLLFFAQAKKSNSPLGETNLQRATTPDRRSRRRHRAPQYTATRHSGRTSRDALALNGGMRFAFPPYDLQLLAESFAPHPHPLPVNGEREKRLMRKSALHLASTLSLRPVPAHCAPRPRLASADTGPPPLPPPASAPHFPAPPAAM